MNYKFERPKQYMIYEFVTDIPFGYIGWIMYKSMLYCYYVNNHLINQDLTNYSKLDGPARLWFDNENSRFSSFHEYHVYNKLISEDQYWNHPLVVEAKLHKILSL